MDNNDSIQIAIFSQGCSRCGCTGIHACLGVPLEPWTDEKIKEFEAILSQYETD